MTTLVIISSTLFAVSLIMAGAMAVAWVSFGKPRHALSWSVAYLLYVGQILCASLGSLIPAAAVVLWQIELLFILAPAALVVMGARQRVGLSSLFKPLGLIVLILFVGTRLIDRLPVDTSYLSCVGSLFTACILPIAILAVRPRDREVAPAEWVMMSALGLFTLFEVALVATDLAAYFRPAVRPVYTATYLIGIMPIFIANGVAAVLLLASDLAGQLRLLATNDPLTGVLNRRGFYDAALRAVSNGRRQRQSIAVCIADIDHFKGINDRFGHTVGDRTLNFICNSLTRGLRGGDLVGRIGGEEFALLLVNSSAEQACEAMERIRAEIAVGYSEDGAPTAVTASFGVAAVSFASGPADQLLADALDQADRALYRSKIEGRNRTTLAI
jgi:diguanylate cyclase (GGDEF)-like protein